MENSFIWRLYRDKKKNYGKIWREHELVLGKSLKPECKKVFVLRFKMKKITLCVLKLPTVSLSDIIVSASVVRFPKMH